MPKTRSTKEDILTTTAKAIGNAAGKIAALTGVAEHEEAQKPKAARPTGRLQKKNKVHLPRLMKKAQKKAALAKA